MRQSQPTFAGGEISDAVAARWDVAKYQTALSRGRNVLGLAQGGQYNRPGFLYGDEVYDSEKRAQLFPFIFASGQAYALEFSPGKMRVYWRGALVVRPKLIITGITQANPAVVTIPDNGYQVGWTIVFDGVEGMVQINGLRGKVLAVSGDDVTIDIDTNNFSAFTGDTGGVAGDLNGGEGGYGPVVTNPPPPEQPDVPTPPPTGGGGGGGGGTGGIDPIPRPLPNEN